MQSNIYAENIKKLRESENISQEVFAKHIGVSRNTVSSWERGIKVPSKDNIQKIMELFNVSKSYLIGDTDNRNINVFKGQLMFTQRQLGGLDAELERDTRRIRLK